MSHHPFPASPLSTRAPRTPDVRAAVLAAGALFSLLCVASLFWMQVELVALLREWARADASLPLIALGTMAAGLLIAAWLGE